MRMSHGTQASGGQLVLLDAVIVDNRLLKGIHMHQFVSRCVCVAVCCIMLQCNVMLQCAFELQRHAQASVREQVRMRCSGLQCVAVWCNIVPGALQLWGGYD